MQFQMIRRALSLLWRLSEGWEAPAVLPMRVQKCPFAADMGESQRLPRCNPEAVGISSETVRQFIEQAGENPRENIHSLTIMRHGKVIAEYSFPPYDREIWHVTHSLCKTITALAVGILIGEGKLHLEDRILDLFSGRVTPASKAHYVHLSVFHLLTMTSGVSFGEMQSVTERDWVQGFLNSPPLFRVGEKFHYNSMNTYMLSAIICVKTGRTLTEFLNERLFRFMGIQNFHWETCPNGLEKGGWGLYLLQEDAAKLGQLLLNRGNWNGRQLVPEDFIRDMCVWHSDPPEEMGRYGYGYQCWLWKRPGSVQMSGLFGQSVLVVPDLDMVIAANAGNGRLFGESDFLKSCSLFLESIESGERTPVPQKPEYVYGLRSVKQYWKDSAVLQGKCYAFRERGTRLLPVFMQLLENSYTSGLEQIIFYCKDDKLYMNVLEGKERNRLAIGFAEAERGCITANGEEHLVAVSGYWESNSVLRVDIAFLEQASTRHMRFCFDTEENLHLKLWETPGKEAIMGGADLLFGEGMVSRRLKKGRWKNKLDILAEPELHGILQNKPVQENNLHR